MCDLSPISTVRDKEQLRNLTALLRQVLAAEAKGLVIVDEGWLTACKTAGKLVDTKKFDLTTGGSGGAGQPQTAASPVKMSKGSSSVPWSNTINQHTISKSMRLSPLVHAAAAKALAGAGLPAPVSSAPPAPHVSKGQSSLAVFAPPAPPPPTSLSTSSFPPTASPPTSAHPHLSDLADPRPPTSFL